MKNKWVIFSFSLMTIILGFVALQVGCGGGGGGGSSVTGTPTVLPNHIRGTVIASGTIPASILPAISGGTGVPSATVYLESNPSITTLSDSTGHFDLYPVPAGNHRVVVSYKNLQGGVWKTRSQVVSIADTHVEIDLGSIGLPAATCRFTGTVTSPAGVPIPFATLTLWGETFQTNQQGQYTTPFMPIGDTGDLVLSAGGYQTVTLPLQFSGNTTIQIGTVLPLTSDTNHAPTALIQTAASTVLPEGSLSFTGVPSDQDGDTLTLAWQATSGTLTKASNGLSCDWVAPPQTGYATITFSAKDPSGLMGSCSVGIHVTTGGGDDGDNIPPAIGTVYPVAGAIGIATNSQITVTFSEPILASSLQGGKIAVLASGTSVAGTVTLSADKMTATFQPTSGLVPSTLHTVTVATAVTDLAGNQLVLGRVWSFTTVSLIPGDTTPPTIVGVFPASSAINIASNTLIAVTFSEPMGAGVETGGYIFLYENGGAIPVTVTFDSARTTATIAPDSPLSAGASEAIVVSHLITDSAGNQLGGTDWQSVFSTAAAPDLTPPVIQAVFPASGAIQVPANSVISIQFDEPLDPTSVTLQTILVDCGGIKPPGIVKVGVDPSTAVFQPSAPLPDGKKIDVQVTSGIRDKKGNSFAGPVAWSFSTALGGADVILPTVAAVSPASGATGVATGSVLSITFSESMNSATLVSANFEVSSGGALISGNVAYSLDQMTMTFTPLAALSPETTYLARVKAAVTDIAGNPLAADMVWTFTTVPRPAPDLTPPQITSTDPASGALAIRPSTFVNIRFNEPMDPTTLTAANFAVMLGAATVPTTLAVNADQMGVTLSPNNPLATYTTYSVWISGRVRDQSSNLLSGGDFRYSFATSIESDITRPQVTGRFPAPDATGVATGSVISVTFSEAMDTSSINASTFIVSCGGLMITGDLAFSPDQMAATFTPGTGLPYGASVSVYIDVRVKDLAGNVLNSAVIWTFSTVPAPDLTPPQVATVQPAAGATGVPISAEIGITFTEPMVATMIDTTTFLVASGGTPLTGTVTTSPDGMMATFTPALSLGYESSIAVTILAGLRDLSGNALQANFISTFTTTPVPDLTPPTVVSIFPASGATHVPVSVGVSVVFNEPMDSTTLNTSSFLVSSGTVPVAGTVAVSTDRQTATFTPSAPLAYDSVLTATLRSSVRDLAGNLLGSDTTWTFSTPVAPDTTPPSIIAVVPAAGATGVATNTQVSVTFDEDMDVSSLNTSTLLVMNGATPVGGGVTVSPDTRTATFTPSLLATNTVYTVTVTSGVRDANGNSPSSNASWNFTTAPDSVPPQLVAYLPASGATGLPVSSLVSVTFDEPMDPSTLVPANIIVSSGGIPISGSFAPGADGMTATFTPAPALGFGTQYTVTVTTGVHDAAGNPLPTSFSWSFFTLSAPDTTPPQVVSAYPVDTASGVPTNTVISLVFDEGLASTSVNGTTFQVNGGAVAGTIDLSPDLRTITFTPSANLANQTLFSVTANTGITDLAGNALGSAFSWSFTTASAPDVTPPQVASRIPATGATGVPIDTEISVTFDEPMDPSTIDSTTFQVATGATPVPGTVSLSPDRLKATFTPTGNLSFDSVHFVTVASGVQDLAGNPLGADHVWSFTTVPAPDVTPPQILSLNPPDTSTGIATNSTVSVSFNEQLDPASVGTSSLVLTDGALPVDGSVTLDGGTQITFHPTNPLSHLVTYTARVTTLVCDSAGNNLPADSTWTFTTNAQPDLTPPTAAFEAVTPTPRNSPVGNVYVNFDEVVQNVTADDFYLSRDGTMVDITGVPFSAISTTRYSLDLSAYTSPQGSYRLEMYASDIQDLAGNSLAQPASVTWNTDTTPPTVTISAISNPRNVPVNVVTLDFSKPVLNFDRSDLTLDLDGSAVSLTGLTLNTVSSTQFTIDLTTVTTANGTYTFTVNVSNIADSVGNSLAAPQTATWLMDNVRPTAAIVPVTPDPRNQPCGLVLVDFSEPVLNTDISDFLLTRDGTSVNLTGIPVTRVTDTRYQFDLTAVTAGPGSYVLTLGPGDITDITGNTLSGTPSDSWVTDTTAPTVTFTTVTPDPRNTVVGSLTLTFSEPVVPIAVSDFSLTRDGAPVSLAGVPVAAESTTRYSLDLTFVTNVPGDYILAIHPTYVMDYANNRLAAISSESWTLEAGAPFATIVAVSPDPRNSSVASLTIDFNEQVQNFDRSELTLTRNGGSVSLAAVPFVQESTTRYSIDLSSLTGTAGAYRLVLSPGNILDMALNPLLGPAAEDWTIDFTSPGVSMVAVSPDPRNSAVASETINFTEAVQGFTVGSLALSRNGTPVPITGVLSQITTTGYALDLSGDTAVPGSYTLTLSPAGITDLASNPLPAGATDSWQMENTAPTATVSTVSPDPRNATVGSITIDFSEAVVNVDRSDFTLTRDGTAVSLSGVPFAIESATRCSFNLTGVSGTSGAYSFTANVSNITDTAGNALVSAVSENWTMDTGAPTAAIASITPDPRNTVVASVTVTFSEAVLNLNIADFSLTRDGTNVSLATVPLALESPTTWSLDLSGCTGPAGTYVLTLNVSDITDAGGNPLAGAVSDSWLTDTTAPTASLTPAIPDPRRLAVGSITVDFTEPVINLGVSDFSLSRDGAPVTLSGVTLVQVSGTRFALNNLSTVTGPAGTYILTLNVSDIRDAASNSLALSVSDSWLMDPTAPIASFDLVLPDPRNVTVASVTVHLTEPVLNLDRSDFTLTRNGGGVSLVVTPFVQESPTVYSLDLTSLTNVDGAYVLTLNRSDIVDAAGNALAAAVSESWTTDFTPLTATMTAISPDPRNTSVIGSITFTFSESVQTLTRANFTLTLGAGNVDISAVPFVRESGSRYSFDLGGVTSTPGTYTITLPAAGVRDLAGNVLASSVTDTWVMDAAAPVAAFVPITPDPRNTGVPTITVNFNEPVTGVAINHFTLSRSGWGNIPLTGVSLTQETSSRYSFNSSTLTGNAGTYTVTITPVAAIRDSAGNSLSAGASDIWVMDLTAPTASISVVTPDPRAVTVASVTIDFSEDMQPPDLADFSLTRNGTAIDLTGVPIVAETPRRWSIDLTSVSANAGTHVITLLTAGVQDLAGNNLGTAVSDTWVMDPDVPTVTIVPITPDPRNSSVGNVTISFNEPVNNVDLTDLALTLNGAPVSIATAPFGANSPSEYYVTLTSFTTQPGTYVITLPVPSDIRDYSGNALASGASDTWVLDNGKPVATFTPVVPDPRNFTVASVAVDFSEAVINLDISDFSLQRNGVGIYPLTGVTLTAISSTSFVINNLSTFNTQNGTYTFNLNPSDIRDSAGNELLARVTETWQMDTIPPVATFSPVTPDPRNNGIASIAINFSETIQNLGVDDFVLTCSSAPVDLSLATLFPESATRWWLSNLDTLTAASGTYELTLLATGVQDLASNSMSGNATESWLVDLVSPVLVIASVTPDPRNTVVGNIVMVFDESVQNFDVAECALTCDGAPVSLTGLSVAAITPATYTLDLTSVTTQPGYYVFTVSPGNITDIVGNPMINPASETWTRDNTGPIATLGPVLPDPRNTAAASVTVVFNEPVTNVDVGDFNLTLNGTIVPLTVASITTISSTTYALDNLSTITFASGTYNLTVSGAGILDLAGNPAQGTASDSWVTDTTPPTVIWFDPASAALDVGAASTPICIRFSENMDPTTISTLTISVSSAGTIIAGTWAVGSDSATFTPTLPFPKVASITVLLNGPIMDPAGNVLASMGWSFRVIPLFLAADGGYDHSVFLHEDGSVYTAGDNQYGQLGNGTTVDSSTLIKVTGLPSVVKEISAGEFTTFAILQTGQLWAWGDDSSNQLGNGPGTAIVPTPQQIGADTWIKVCGGYDHTLGLKSDGTVWAWGENSSGQLGDCSTMPRDIPTLITIPGPGGVADISAGYITSAFLKSNGSVWYCGRGLATPTMLTNPTNVARVCVSQDMGGNPHVYSLMGDGSVYIESTLLSGVSQVRYIAGSKCFGVGHLVALCNDGTIKCYGKGTWGQLGNGAFLDSGIWVTSNIQGVKKVGAGATYSFGVKHTGHVLGWGDHNFGQLGMGLPNNWIATPTKILWPTP